MRLMTSNDLCRPLIAFLLRYELVAGKTKHTKALPPESFYYINLSGTMDCPGRDDAEEYRNTASALLSGVGLSADEADQMWAGLHD